MDYKEKCSCFSIDNSMEIGICSQCGAEVPVELLSFLPKTEKYYRKLLLKKEKRRGHNNVGRS